MFSYQGLISSSERCFTAQAVDSPCGRAQGAWAAKQLCKSLGCSIVRPACQQATRECVVRCSVTCTGLYSTAVQCVWKVSCPWWHGRTQLNPDESYNVFVSLALGPASSGRGPVGCKGRHLL